MDFLSFREKFIETGCVNTHQFAVAYPDYNRNNLTRWVKQGLLTKLRNGYYSFPELRGQSHHLVRSSRKGTSRFTLSVSVL